MRKANMVLSSIFGIFSIVVIVYTSSFPGANRGVPGPGMWPIMICVLMLACSVSVFINALRAKTGEPFPVATRDNIRVYITIASLIVYLFLMPKLGFVVTSIPFTAVYIKWFHKGKIFLSILYAALAVIATFLVFTRVLMVPLRFGMFI